MENTKNTERKTVIKTQKFDGCFFTSSLRKSHTSRLSKQICKKPQILDMTVKIEARRTELVQNVELVDMAGFARV